MIARHIPAGMSFQDAAAIPVAALRALNGLRRCGITAGSRLLINRATGGAGHFAVQIAKAKGAVITASSSEVNKELAMQLGADKIIVYRREDIANASDEYDAILDTWGHMKFKDISAYLKRVAPMPHLTTYFVCFDFLNKYCLAIFKQKVQIIEHS